MSNTKTKFINPFDVGVTYKDLDKALNGKSVSDYCKGELNKDQINYLTVEFDIYKNNIKKQK